MSSVLSVAYVFFDSNVHLRPIIEKLYVPADISHFRSLVLVIKISAILICPSTLLSTSTMLSVVSLSNQMVCLPALSFVEVSNHFGLVRRPVHRSLTKVEAPRAKADFDIRTWDFYRLNLLTPFQTITYTKTASSIQHNSRNLAHHSALIRDNSGVIRANSSIIRDNWRYGVSHP